MLEARESRGTLAVTPEAGQDDMPSPVRSMIGSSSLTLSSGRTSRFWEDDILLGDFVNPPQVTAVIIKGVELVDSTGGISGCVTFNRLPEEPSSTSSHASSTASSQFMISTAAKLTEVRVLSVGGAAWTC